MSQSTIQVVNQTASDVEVFITLGAVAGCVPSVNDLSFVTNRINNLQGSFHLAGNQSISYTSPAGMGFNGNFSFGYAPSNCPTPQYPSGINLAEFILNNAFQGPGAQETIDISAVAGVNAILRFDLQGGGSWNAGNTRPNVTSFENKAIGENTGLVGVFPYACDNCTASVAPPVCPSRPAGAPNPPRPQAEPICNVQRDASQSGGTVIVTFKGFVR
jgi:hypothetical protein